MMQFETPALFGVNFQQMAGFSQGSPFLGSNILQQSLSYLGDIEHQIGRYVGGSFSKFVGMPLSLLVVDSYMSEEHSSGSNITSDPVESGPNITSHTYPMPTQVKLDFVVNDTFLTQFSIAGKPFSKVPFANSVNRSSLAYTVVDSLRRSSIPVFLSTRTSIYKSMLIKFVNVKRDVDYYTRSMFSIIFQQLYEAKLGYASELDEAINNDVRAQSLSKSGIRPPQ